MLLDIEKSDFQMKRVFSLAEELSKNPERVSLTQALTLDESRPFFGLKGSNGLFGSEEWWRSIEQRKMALLFVSGRVRASYVAGQDKSIDKNTVDLEMNDGEVVSVGIYTNDKLDTDLFREGAWVEMVYALDELKMQPASDGSPNYSKVALEVAVSLE
jgi:hypothetical protein